MSTLADKVASDVTNVWLQAGHFRVGATYWPVNGSARSVWVVAQTQSKRTEEQPHHKVDTQEVNFLASADVTTGIPDAQLGDALRLDTDKPDDRWDFVQIVDSGPGFVLLRFAKRKLLRSGQFRPSGL